MTETIRLGMCIPKGKRERIDFPNKIRHLCQKENIKIIEIDVDESLENQGPFHVLLHKVLDYYNEMDPVEAKQRINKLINYSRKNKNMIVLDNFHWCLKLTNRKYMFDLIKSCEFTMNGIRVFLPKTLEITKDMSLQERINVISFSGMKFPLVSKSYSAYFDDGAHDMYLIFSLDAIEDIKPPCLLQEFCNHGGVLYKVFVVGDTFNICERPSIKDFTEDHSKQTIYFDSFRVSKLGKPFVKNLQASDPNTRHWKNCDQVQELLDTDVIQRVISRIHGQTGLYLYGFDVLIEKETGNYCIIDVNQFPSYIGIGPHHFPRNLVGLIKDLHTTL